MGSSADTLSLLPSQIAGDDSSSSSFQPLFQPDSLCIDKNTLSTKERAVVSALLEKLVFIEMSKFGEAVEIATVEQKRHEAPVVNHFKALTVVPDKPVKLIREYIWKTEFGFRFGTAPEIVPGDEGPSIQEALKQAAGNSSACHKASSTQPRSQTSGGIRVIVRIGPSIVGSKLHKQEVREKSGGGTARLATTFTDRLIESADKLIATSKETKELADNFEQYLRSCRKKRQPPPVSKDERKKGKK